MHAAKPITFTVVIPTYNGQAYLRQTIEGVLAQTYPPTEILCIDDGSRDQSAAIAGSFGPTVQTISRSNRGVSASRNFGAALASTGWLAFLDHDDLWEPEFLERQAANLSLSDEADISYTGRRLLTQRSDETSFELSEPISVPTPEQLAAVLPDRCPFTPSAVVLRRETFFAVGGFRSQHDGVEDWDMWLRLHYFGARFTHCPEPLVRYRVHREGASQNAVSMYGKNLGVVDANIFPQMTPLQRLTAGRRIKSRLQAEAAILMREQGNAGSLRMMLASLAQAPFHAPRRYKIAAHMLLRP
jgi:glycosyltransferase involved in cell wall biosynthesis